MILQTMIMNKKIKLLLFLFFLLVHHSSIQAQIVRGDWSYGPVIQTDNYLYFTLANELSHLPASISFVNEDYDAFLKKSYFYYKNEWWIPTFYYRANIVQKMEFPDDIATLYPKTWGLSHWDWSLRNYALGYHIGYLSSVSPIGFDLQADYIHDGYLLKMDKSSETQEIIKKMLSATALIKVRFMDFDKFRLNPVLELGGSYNYAFHYHDDAINDRDAVNDGFTWIVGLGYISENRFSSSLRYERLLYEFYNTKYLYKGKAVFAGAKSTFGKLAIAVSYNF